MNTFKTPTKKIDVTANIIIKKTINVPAGWTGEQIDQWVWGMDMDTFYNEFYDITPDSVDLNWKMYKEKKNA